MSCLNVCDCWFLSILTYLGILSTYFIKPFLRLVSTKGYFKFCLYSIQWFNLANLIDRIHINVILQENPNNKHRNLIQ